MSLSKKSNLCLDKIQLLKDSLCNIQNNTRKQQKIPHRINPTKQPNTRRSKPSTSLQKNHNIQQTDGKKTQIQRTAHPKKRNNTIKQKQHTDRNHKTKIQHNQTRPRTHILIRAIQLQIPRILFGIEIIKEKKAWGRREFHLFEADIWLVQTPFEPEISTSSA